MGVVTLQAQPVTLTADLPGRTAAYQISDVRPQVNGLIKARLFTEGADVGAGQPLYLIDPAPYRAAYAQAQAQLASAQANVVTARLKAERYASLVKINAVSRQEADDANAAGGQAAAAVQQYAAALQTARINLGYTKVTAPISGRIGRALATPGALVTADQTTALATIQSLDPIYVDVVRSSDELLVMRREINAGSLNGPATARVKLQLSDGSTYGHEGVLKLSEAQVDPATGSVTLRAVFPNPQRLLLPGMYVRAQVVEAVDPDGLLVPQQGVTRDEKGNATALIVDAAGKAQTRTVTVDRALGDKWLVSAGLKPGDRVIVEGVMNVRQPGTPVHAVPAGSAPAAAAAPPGGKAAVKRPGEPGPTLLFERSALSAAEPPCRASSSNVRSSPGCWRS